jgi:membrane protease YdiL (CAAX protease family)
VTDWPALSGFLAAAVVVSFLWGRALWYFDERSAVFRRWVLFAMGYTRRRIGEVRSLLLSAIYYGLGLLLGLLFAAVLGLPVSSLFSISAAYLGMVVIGSVGEISLTNLLVDLSCRVTGQVGPERFAEVQEIPWLKGIRQLPGAAAPVVAAVGGIVEELFFRGFLLRIMTERLFVAPLAAVAIAGTLFCLQQLVQVRTAFQALVIGCGCVAISLVGGALVVVTGNVVPAALCHASFVLFFLGRRDAASAGPNHRRTEAAFR